MAKPSAEKFIPIKLKFHCLGNICQVLEKRKKIASEMILQPLFLHKPFPMWLIIFYKDLSNLLLEGKKIALTYILLFYIYPKVSFFTKIQVDCG